MNNDDAQLMYSLFMTSVMFKCVFLLQYYCTCTVLLCFSVVLVWWCSGVYYICYSFWGFAVEEKEWVRHASNSASVQLKPFLVNIHKKEKTSKRGRYTITCTMLVRTTGCQYCTEVACVVTVQQLQLSRKIHARKKKENKENDKNSCNIMRRKKAS